MSFIWDNFERTDLDIVQSGIIFHKIVTVMLSTWHLPGHDFPPETQYPRPVLQLHWLQSLHSLCWSVLHKEVDAVEWVNIHVKGEAVALPSEAGHDALVDWEVGVMEQNTLSGGYGGRDWGEDGREAGSVVRYDWGHLHAHPGNVPGLVQAGDQAVEEGVGNPPQH